MSLQYFDKEMSFYLFIAISFYLFIAILWAKILCVNRALAFLNAHLKVTWKTFFATRERESAVNRFEMQKM
jgi:hypothetical protein